MRRIPAPLILAVGAVGWLATKERNPLKWPGFVAAEAREIVRDAREAVVDGAQAGVRAEKAFDHDLDEARRRAHTW